MQTVTFFFPDNPVWKLKYQGAVLHLRELHVPHGNLISLVCGFKREKKQSHAWILNWLTFPSEATFL